MRWEEERGAAEERSEAMVPGRTATPAQGRGVGGLGIRGPGMLGVLGH